jgi:predicted metalloprotease with PDZ domain
MMTMLLSLNTTLLRSLLAGLILATSLPASPAVALQAGAGAAAGDTVRYEVAFPNASHHEAEITVTWTGLPSAPLEVRMSRSSPGRYALHEFAKNVYNVRAVDGGGTELRVTRPNPHQWDVAGHDGTVRVSYTLFADRADGTYAAVDLTQAHLNMPATFMWARGTAERPVAVRFAVPEGTDWKIATQLRPTGDPAYFVAPHFQYFMDSPTHLSNFDLREWQETIGGPAQTIRIALHHLGTAAELDEYARHTRAIVREQAAVFGELPRFDYGTYTFIAAYVPWASGDGMEHRNSTILTSSSSLATNMIGLLGTVSHEFFHAWNVERIRPRSLEPFDFERENMSGELWFAEGFTSYYGPLTMRRAGVIDDARYATGLTGMLNTVLNAPGRRFFSPFEMSLQAPFVDAATAVDPHNRANTFISYYTWGAAIGLGLDLTIRTRFAGLSLDDFMRALWLRYGAHEADHAPLRPYGMRELRETLGQVVGDTAFAHDFFRRYIEGREVVDYAALLAHAGIALRPARPGAPSIGSVRYDVQEGAVHVGSPVLIGTALHAAGVSGGDRLVALDGQPVASAAAVDAAVAAKRPGDPIEIRFQQRGVERTARVAVGEVDALEVVLHEAAGMGVTPAVRAFRESWLGPR